MRSLRHNSTSTLASLAEAVGASRLTVLRDISALLDQGLVMYSESGRGAACNWSHNPFRLQLGSRLPNFCSAH
nr:HTH domain-containing protein [Pseudochrobactrum sp. Wa41.01b-1]